MFRRRPYLKRPVQITFQAAPVTCLKPAILRAFTTQLYVCVLSDTLKPGVQYGLSYS